MHKKIRIPGFLSLLILAYILWYNVFKFSDFLYVMLISSFVLAVLGVIFGADIGLKVNKLEAVLIILETALMYFLFWILRFIANFFEPLREGIEDIYRLMDRYDFVLLIIVLMLIGIFEEIFWRGFVTKALVDSIDNPVIALTISSAIYSLIYLYTMNIVLVISAFIIGLIFSVTYFITGKVTTTMYIHMLWTPLIFAILPLN
ncbi:CPBP family intramembrane metalloprotease [Thermosipho ferrireducens]|uniref:CPBP family intramembrane metalloprotease n=1 Tax=Thermosipho ferrireducens TaxID=2571116 RepID=A0ABX7S756_9BACT|nr:type II CAAX endopeptidase family protein [Thermosipho ferrireducens]QTA38039.1 CPBP family intramembrane metalloprotease [Thermosipho ferrireducens]